MKETNMEHYRSEILENLHSINLFGVVNGNCVTNCNLTKCKCCDFSSYKNDGTAGMCHIRRIEWMMSEYKPEPVLTAREKHFVEFIYEGWIARDEIGSLYWHKQKPYKHMQLEWKNEERYLQVDAVLRNAFPFITWEDEEPWAVEELRKLKALEYNPEDVAFVLNKGTKL